VQGAQDQVTGPLAAGDAASAELSRRERALLDFAKLVTEAAHQTTATDVQALRDTGWTDEQIAEAVYVVAMFAFFNRVADAFGLQDPSYGDDGPPVQQ